MKKKIYILAGLLTIFLIPSFAYSSGLGEMRISLIEGDVQVRTADAADWVPASTNMPLVEGDGLWVPDGARLEVQMRDGTAIRLDERSSLEIVRIENDSSQYYLGEGRAYVNFRKKGTSLLQMDTPGSSVRAYDKSVFRVYTTGSGDTEVSVIKGFVYAENRSGSTRVPSNRTLFLSGNEYPELASLGPADEWEIWNRDRDRQLYRRARSFAYLPADIAGYGSDLDEYGRWVSTADYGYVWTPSAVVSGWSPYRQGRWVWIGGDYVWVSYEPWGWLPYHYGRWAFVGSVGWCWVPPARGAAYWGPGFVGWVSTPTYVSWVPLAPGDIYYGHGYYGPNSVNVANIDIHKTVVHKVYKNAHLNNAVTTINKDAFIGGRRTEMHIAENPFLRQKLSLGRPDIKPGKAAFMPVVKEIPRAKLPPAQVRNTQVGAIRQDRPLVKEPKASIFRPLQPVKAQPLPTLDKRPRDTATAPQMKESRPGGGQSPFFGPNKQPRTAPSVQKGSGLGPQGAPAVQEKKSPGAEAPPKARGPVIGGRSPFKGPDTSVEKAAKEEKNLRPVPENRPIVQKGSGSARPSEGRAVEGKSAGGEGGKVLPNAGRQQSPERSSQKKETPLKIAPFGKAGRGDINEKNGVDAQKKLFQGDKGN